MTDFTAEEQALIDEAAQAVVKRRFAVPAMMFLETVSPMNTVTASMLYVLMPVWKTALPASKIDRVATLLERREAIPALIRAIDEGEEERRRQEVAERKQRRAARAATRRERREQRRSASQTDSRTRS